MVTSSIPTTDEVIAKAWKSARPSPIMTRALLAHPTFTSRSIWEAVTVPHGLSCTLTTLKETIYYMRRSGRLVVVTPNSGNRVEVVYALSDWYREILTDFNERVMHLRVGRTKKLAPTKMWLSLHNKRGKPALRGAERNRPAE